jgi:hypothetical protein
METFTRRFILETTRSKKGVIVDAVGNLGNWPFRRTISYNVGVNCDAIEARDGLLRVLRHGRTVAIAELPPPEGLLQRLLNWRTRLLHPRHARKCANGPASRPWEDLLRPPR